MAAKTTTPAKVAATSERAANLLQALLSMESVPRPSDSLNPLLDATERCITRYGFARTSMSDLAREMHVARTTLYRQVDSVDDALLLVGARIVHRFMDEIGLALLNGQDWREMFIDTVVRLITLGREDPITRRIIEHEPETLGAIASSDLGTHTMRRLIDVATPLLTTARLGGDDPSMAAELLARTILGLLVQPTEHDLTAMVEFSLRPLLPPPV
ncbi:TetR/AcrR family transcriptional regulator [Nocardia crassostreae]|uniref:TetR/AcrR family transcriptional regulator n=1 Tax=Nocardia crassostreae TaxID=53428 RepID=UPI000831586B|nr:helix-turn-helix domain-containing protein [Nocardia crassostreae]